MYFDAERAGAQFDGMLEGVARGCPAAVKDQVITYEKLLLLNLNGDLFDLMEKVHTPKVGRYVGSRKNTVTSIVKYV